MVRHVMQVGFVPGGGWHLRDYDARRQLKVPSLDTMLVKRKAQWIGHVARMDVHRSPKAVLFGTIANRYQPQGAATKGWRRLRYTAQVPQVISHMKGIDSRTWAVQAQDKAGWKDSVDSIDAALVHPNQTDEVTCPIC